MEINVGQDPVTGDVVGTGRVNVADFTAAGTNEERRKVMQTLAGQIERAIVGHVAEQFLKEHLQDVLAEINPIAVANLALARVAEQVVRQVTPWAAPKIEFDETRPRR